MYRRATWHLRAALLLILMALVFPAVTDTRLATAAAGLSEAPTVAPSPSATSTTFSANRVAWLPLIVLPLGSTSGPCLCTEDLYNCTRDFATQAEAQACFDHCWDRVSYDIHRLDADGDGEACETLPR